MNAAKIAPIVIAIFCIAFWGFLTNQAMKEEVVRAPCNSCWWLKFAGIFQVIMYFIGLLGAIGFIVKN